MSDDRVAILAQELRSLMPDPYDHTPVVLIQELWIGGETKRSCVWAEATVTDAYPVPSDVPVLVAGSGPAFKFGITQCVIREEIGIRRQPLSIHAPHIAEAWKRGYLKYRFVPVDKVPPDLMRVEPIKPAGDFDPAERLLFFQNGNLARMFDADGNVIGLLDLGVSFAV